MVISMGDDRHFVVDERTLAEKLEAARPDADLLTLVADEIWSTLRQARERQAALGCCWDQEACRAGDCHRCRCVIPPMYHPFDHWRFEPAPPVVVRHGDEGPHVHLWGAREQFYRVAYAQAKLVPELVRRMALEHAGLDLRNADDAELRGDADARLTEILRELPAGVHSELRDRQLR
jgi:hypothetical protein